MSTDEKSELIVNDLTVVSKLEVGNADLVNIAVAQRELTLMKEEENLEAEYRKLQNELVKQNSAFEKSIAEFAVSAVEDRAKKVAAGYKAFNLPVRFNVTASTYNEKKGKVPVSIVFHAKEHGFSSMLSVEEDATEEIKTMFAEIGAKHVAIQECAEKRIQNKRNLSRLSTIERQARAALATASLKQSPRGLKILEEINGIDGLKLLEQKG